MAKKKLKQFNGKNLGVYILGFLAIFLSLVFLNSQNKVSEFKITTSSSESSPSAQIASSPTPSPKPQVAELLTPKKTIGIPVLTYHYITNNPNPEDKARDSLQVPPDVFEGQMEYLSSNGYTPISLDTLYGILNGQANITKPVVLTFDDGYIDFYTNAYPVLRRFNFHSVSFIPTGLIGSSYYMNWDHIKEMASSGLVTFEDHTISHPNLTALSYSEVLRQMVESKKMLESQTGYPVNFIAYPYGISNGSVWQAAKEAGFIGGVGTYFGKVTGGSLNMPRIKVSGFWSIEEFASRL